MEIFEMNPFDKTHKYITGSDYLDLYAKVSALDLHRYRNTPKNLQPQISELIPQRAHGYAHEIIMTALKYFEEGAETNQITDEALQNAAQLLEKLYISTPVGSLNREKELHMAALAYYLSGHYARAYVLMRGVNASDDQATNLMRFLFLRQLSKIKDETLSVLYKDKYIDNTLATSVRDGYIDDIDAIHYALEGTINRIYILLHEFARKGEEHLIDKAIAYASLGLKLSIEQEMSDCWQVFRCTLAMLHEYRRNSLWTCLRSMMTDDAQKYVERYIKTAFLRQPLPILELWRSQSHVIDHINDGKSYCLKMPTSSGKTRIAELAILKFLINSQENLEKKCLYIAPYRALAVELEQSLSRSFEPIGIGVSQLYGSYDLNPAESLIVDDSKILIATPEKMDAFLRYNTDIAQKIGLIIIDEGHIIDATERGIRYELFLHRIISRYERQGIRMLFISAVMPNVEQFAQWITGRNSDAVLESDWRASQLLIGILDWDGSEGHIDYTHRNFDVVDQSFFIRKYFSCINPQELKDAKCKKRSYPGKNATKSQLTALAALKAASEGSTLVFTPQKDNVESIANAIIKSVNLQKQINHHFNAVERVLPINTDDEKAQKLASCIRYAEETTGTDSLVVQSLKCGFVIHHGGIPRSLRVHLEDLMRDGVLQLVVANTTLAQGVNLPVKTILIHSLYNSQKLINVRDFWNLCGRAGRAMYETEGHVYLIVDTSKSKKEFEETKKTIQKFVRQRNSEKIISGIKQLLDQLIQAWQIILPQVGPGDIAELCQLLASNDKDWLNPIIKRKLCILDAQLLALIEEQEIADITDPNINITEQITALFQDSMLYIQLADSNNRGISTTEAISLIVHRIQYVFKRCKTKSRRQCYYSMALSIDGCSTIEEIKLDIVNYLRMSADFMDWIPEERAMYIVKLCNEFLMKIEDIRVSSEGKEPSDIWPLVLKHWLQGENASQIAKAEDIPEKERDAMKISTLIDDLCDFRLPWGLNAVAMFLKTANNLEENTEEDASFILPEIINYFASMLRFGVHNPVATVALALGLDNRQAALELSNLYKGSIDATNIISWLLTLEAMEIEASIHDVLLRDLCIRFIEDVRLKRSFRLPSFRSPRIEYLEVIEPLQGADIQEEMTLLYEIEDDSFHLYTPDSDYLGKIIVNDNDLLQNLNRNASTVKIIKINRIDTKMELCLQINSPISWSEN